MRFLRYLPALAALAILPTSAMAEDMVFKLINKSSFVITELYASPSNVKSWEEDILGTDVLGSGETVRRACEYDLRIVFDDGDAIEDTTDLCETASYTVTD